MIAAPDGSETGVPANLADALGRAGLRVERSLDEHGCWVVAWS
jgi:hypothetical protein